MQFRTAFRNRKCPPKLSLDEGTEENSSNGSGSFYHKFSLAAACKHHRGLFPFSCNLTPLPAYLWEMSTCSLDVFQGLCMARCPLLTVTHSSPVGSVS